MKRLFRRNQFFVTMLAVLIAVAGYFNYAQNLTEKEMAAQVNNTYEAVYEGDDLLSSDGDILSMDVDTIDSEDAKDVSASENEVAEYEEEGNEIESENNKSENIEDFAAGAEGETLEPGAAVLTSNNKLSDFAIKARLDREQIRSKNKETLLEIINNEDISNEQKQDAVDAMVEMTKLGELENNIETILEAKGFTDVIVTLSEKHAEVIINMNEIDDGDRAQIEDVITRKTDLKVSDIIITPLS